MNCTVDELPGASGAFLVEYPLKYGGIEQVNAVVAVEIKRFDTSLRSHVSRVGIGSKRWTTEAIRKA